MQPLTAAPRSGLTAERVTALLMAAPSVQVAYGADLLGPDLVQTGTLDLLGGKIMRNFLANIHGTCDLQIDQDVQYGTALVRPWQELSAPGITARWNLGAYVLTSPVAKYGTEPRVREVQGYDRIYLMARQIGSTHVAPKDAGVLDEVRRIITLAGLVGVSLDGTAQAETLAEPMIWPLVPPAWAVVPAEASGEPAEPTGPTTYLRVANDLLFSIGYRGLYADPATGFFRSEPYVLPASRPVEFTFQFDSPIVTTVAPERTVTMDDYKAPNYWVFVRQNMPGNPPVTPNLANGGVYIVDKTATDPRGGMRWVEQIPLDVANGAALIAQGDNRVQRDSRAKTTLSVTMSPFPAAGHGDIYRYNDPVVGSVLVQEGTWSLPLDGSDMTREWSIVG